MSLIIPQRQSQTGSVIHRILSAQLAQAVAALLQPRQHVLFCVITDHRQFLLTQPDFTMISTFMKRNCTLLDLLGYYCLNPYVGISFWGDTL